MTNSTLVVSRSVASCAQWDRDGENHPGNVMIRAATSMAAVIAVLLIGWLTYVAGAVGFFLAALLFVAAAGVARAMSRR